MKERINLDISSSKFLSFDENYQGKNTFNQINTRRVLTFSSGEMNITFPWVAYTHCGIMIRERSGDLKAVQIIRKQNTG